MKIATTAGVVLGLLVGIWTMVMGFTGWYKDPVLLNAFWLVIPMEIVALIWALRKTAAAGAGYGRQVVNGLVVSLVASVIIFGASLLFTSVVFPHYFDELRAMHFRMLKEAGKTASEIEATLRQNAASETPLANALAGVVGTVTTGLTVSLIAAIRLRSK